MTERRTKGITTRFTLPALRTALRSTTGSRWARLVGLLAVGAGAAALVRKRLAGRRAVPPAVEVVEPAEVVERVEAVEPAEVVQPVEAVELADVVQPVAVAEVAVVEPVPAVEPVAVAEVAVVEPVPAVEPVAVAEVAVVEPVPAVEPVEFAVAEAAEPVPVVEPATDAEAVEVVTPPLVPGTEVVTPPGALVPLTPPGSDTAALRDRPSDAPQLAYASTPFPGDGSARRKVSRWNIVGMVSLGLLIGAIIVASLIRLPYYRIEPGSVYDTIERVEAPGELVFVPEGDIGFVTVSQTADISVWQWLDAQLDENVIIKHEDEVNGDQTAEEKREQDQRRMQLSKNSAVVVALDRLGFELIVTPIGIEVAQVFECTAAEGVLGTGDLIVGVNGVDVRDGEDLVAQLGEREIGEEVELLVDRIDPNNSAATLRTDVVGLRLGSMDAECLPDDVQADAPRPFIGIGTNTIYEEDLPIDVNIDTGRVGGPSAGLAFTLAIMDVLSEGELTNGLKIVATGTIDRDGNVGPIGGIHQKTIAAERSGADVFLVPSCCDNFVDRETGEPLDIPTNYEEAAEHADEMLVIGVANLDEAIAAIGELGGDVEPFLQQQE